MSKSYKKTPRFGNCSHSNSKCKVQSNKKFRRKEKVLCKTNEDFFLTLRDVSNVWSSPQDGKYWWWTAGKKELSK